MKQSFFVTLFLVVILFSAVAQAQIPGVSKVTKEIPKVVLGLKAGANFQNLNSNSTFANSYQGGIVAGAFLGLTKNKWGIQVEGLIKTVKYSFIDSVLGNTGNKDINTINLDVPVLLEYKLIPRLWVQVGPQFSSILSAKNGSTDVKTSFNSTDYSGVLGLQLVLPVHFVLGARYVLGLSDINNKSVSGYTDSWHNRSFQAYLGWRFL